MSHDYTVNTLMPLAKCVDYISEEQCKNERERSKLLVESGALDAIDSATSKHHKEDYSIFWLSPDTLKETSGARMDLFIKLYDINLEKENQKDEPDPKEVESLKVAQNSLKEVKVSTSEAIDQLFNAWKIMAFPPLLLVWLLMFAASKALNRLLPRTNPHKLASQ